MSEAIFISKHFLVSLERISLNPTTDVLDLVPLDIPCFAVLSNLHCHKCGRKFEMVWVLLYFVEEKSNFIC